MLLSRLKHRLLLRNVSRSPKLVPYPYASSRVTISHQIRYSKSLSTPKPSYPELDETFSNAKEAFKSKSTWEVFRALAVYQLLTINYLADHQMRLMKLGQKFMGRRLIEKLMELTFYGHFVAGKDESSIKPKIQKMRDYGVKAILDYSAEEDVTEDQDSDYQSIVAADSNNKRKDKCLKMYEGNISASQRRNKAVNRTYFYENEAACYTNMEIFINSIRAVASATDGEGFAAIKATAICKPQLLLRLSEAIERVHVFVQYFTGTKDAVNNQHLKIEELKKRFANAALEDPSVQLWLDSIDSDAFGIINLLPWKSLLIAKRSVREAMRIPNIETGHLEDIACPFSEEEIQAFNNALERYHAIFEYASKANVRVMVDAEQTYLQPAISRVTVEMMKIYNQEKAVIFNTYQCYLKQAVHDLMTDIKQAERQGFYFGVKLVRGAYMKQERQRAEQLEYDDPINPNYEATTQMYELCMDQCLLQIKKNGAKGQPRTLQVMAATHNEDTIRSVIRRMDKYGIGRGDRVVSFGQLYGMCDQISFPMGQAGYSVYKYVPFGPVLEVLPYLSRRAQENKGFMGKTDKERRLLRQEMFRRIRTGQLK